MTKHNQGPNIKRTSLRALAAALAVFGTTVTAFAGTQTGSPTKVIVYSVGGSSLNLQIVIGGVNTYGQLTTQAGCTANNQLADTLKAWQSLGEAALMSGKTLVVSYTVCSGVNYITTVELDQ